MNVTVLLFASYADALGARSLDVEVREGATVAELLEGISARDRSGRLPPSPLVAVNQRYAQPEQALARGDEVAILPPVAGG